MDLVENSTDFTDAELTQVKEIEKRVAKYIKQPDLRIISDCYAIDNSTTHDKDDAIYIEIKGDIVIFRIYISDITNFVAKDSPLDKKAKQRSATIYGGSSVVQRMFPSELCDNLFSLHSGKLTPAVEIITKISLKSGEILNVNYDRVLVNAKNLTYNEVAENITKRSSIFKKWSEVSGWLGRNRSKSLHLPYYDAETQILKDEQGIDKYVPRAIYPAYLIVQEAMILTNVAIANLLTANFKEAIYRVHNSSSNQNSAYYSPIVKKHQGLKVTISHSTSPNRRYADIVAHRILSNLALPIIIKHEPKILSENAGINRPFDSLEHNGQNVVALRSGNYSAEELESVCRYLSESAERNRTTRKEIFRRRASALLNKVFPDTDEKKLAGFDPASFSHLLREATEQGNFSTVFNNEILKRLEGKGGNNGDIALNSPRDYVYILTIKPEFLTAEWKTIQQKLLEKISDNKTIIESVFTSFCCKLELKTYLNHGSIIVASDAKPGGRKISFAAIIFEKGGKTFASEFYSFGVRSSYANARAKLEFLKCYVSSNLAEHDNPAMPNKITFGKNFSIENPWSRVKKICHRMGYSIAEQTQASNSFFSYEITISSLEGKVLFHTKSTHTYGTLAKEEARYQALRCLIIRGDAENNLSSIPANATFTFKLIGLKDSLEPYPQNVISIGH